MMSPGSVSVIVPTWNRADLLPETLECILAQDAPAGEVIVVDDGSGDATPALLARYASRGVRGIRIPNSGDLRARNVGLRAAQGDLVAFCDSDDLWEPGFLGAMGALWRAEPRTRAAYADFRIVRGGVREEGTKFAAAPAGFWDGLRPVGEDMLVFDGPVAPRLVRYQPFFPSALVADRRFLLEAGGWDEGTSGLVGRDLATAMRIAEHAPLGILRRPMVGIRKHATNDSGDVLSMNLGDSAVLEHVLRTRPAMAPHAEAIRASVTARRRQAMDTAFARGRFDAVREIGRQLPPGALPFLGRLKHLTAGLPAPARSVLARALLLVGTMRARSRLRGRDGDERRTAAPLSPARPPATAPPGGRGGPRPR